MLSYKYHEWSTGTFDTIKISSYFLLKMNKFSLVAGLNCPEYSRFMITVHRYSKVLIIDPSTGIAASWSSSTGAGTLRVKISIPVPVR